ncbi:hypothetical protein BDV11DRAFT_96011 [Aspergillus similis]
MKQRARSGRFIQDHRVLGTIIAHKTPEDVIRTRWASIEFCRNWWPISYASDRISKGLGCATTSDAAWKCREHKFEDFGLAHYRRKELRSGQETEAYLEVAVPL